MLHDSEADSKYDERRSRHAISPKARGSLVRQPRRSPSGKDRPKATREYDRRPYCESEPPFDSDELSIGPDRDASDHLDLREAWPAKNPSVRPLDDEGLVVMKVQMKFTDGSSFTEKLYGSGTTHTTYRIRRLSPIGAGVLKSSPSSGRAEYHEPVSQYPRPEIGHAPLREGDRCTGPRNSTRPVSTYDEYYIPTRHDRSDSMPIQYGQYGNQVFPPRYPQHDNVSTRHHHYDSTPAQHGQFGNQDFPTRYPERPYVPARPGGRDYMPAQHDEQGHFIPVRYYEFDYVPAWYDEQHGMIIPVRYSKNYYTNAWCDGHGNSIPVRYDGDDYLPSENWEYGIYIPVRYRGRDLVPLPDDKNDSVAPRISKGADRHPRLLEAPSVKGGRRRRH